MSVTSHRTVQWVKWVVSRGKAPGFLLSKRVHFNSESVTDSELSLLTVRFSSTNSDFLSDSAPPAAPEQTGWHSDSWACWASIHKVAIKAHRGANYFAEIPLRYHFAILTTWHERFCKPSVVIIWGRMKDWKLDSEQWFWDALRLTLVVTKVWLYWLYSQLEAVRPFSSYFKYRQDIFTQNSHSL